MERNKTTKKRRNFPLILLDLIAIVMLLKFFVIPNEVMNTLAWLFSMLWLAVRIGHGIITLIVYYAKNKEIIKTLRKNWKRELSEE